MKVRERLTKAGVLVEVNDIRDKIRNYEEMSREELAAEYRRLIPHTYHPEYVTWPKWKLLARLTMLASYHLTNVLGLE